MSAGMSYLKKQVLSWPVVEVSAKVVKVITDAWLESKLVRLSHEELSGRVVQMLDKQIVPLHLEAMLADLTSESQFDLALQTTDKKFSIQVCKYPKGEYVLLAFVVCNEIGQIDRFAFNMQINGEFRFPIASAHHILLNPAGTAKFPEQTYLPNGYNGLLILYIKSLLQKFKCDSVMEIVHLRRRCDLYVLKNDAMKEA